MPLTFPELGLSWRFGIAVPPAEEIAGQWDVSTWDSAAVWGGSQIEYEYIDDDAISVVVSMGKEDLGQRFRLSTAVIVLDNSRGIYNSQSSVISEANIRRRLTPGKFVTLEANWGPTWQQQFVGFIDTIEEQMAPGGSTAYTSIQCVGYGGLFSSRSDVPLLTPVSGGQASNLRVEEILDLYGWSSGLRAIQPGVATMQEYTRGRSYWEEMQVAADAEGGGFYFDKIGNATFKARDWLTTDSRSTDVQLYIGVPERSESPEVINVDASWSFRYIFNDIQYQRNGGTLQQVADSTSVAEFGRRTLKRTSLENNADPEVLNLALKDLEQFKDNAFRLRSVECHAHNNATAKALLQTFIGDMVTVRVTTLQGWQYQITTHVLGIGIELTASDMVITLRVDDAGVPEQNLLIGTGTLTAFGVRGTPEIGG